MKEGLIIYLCIGMLFNIIMAISYEYGKCGYSESTKRIYDLVEDIRADVPYWVIMIFILIFWPMSFIMKMFK